MHIFNFNFGEVSLTLTAAFLETKLKFKHRYMQDFSKASFEFLIADVNV